MPWCGPWGTAFGGFWWVFPLLGLLFMGVMIFLCFRGFGFGCMGRRSRSGDVSGLQREVESLREDVRKLVRQPN
jgi:hypothetical protein